MEETNLAWLILLNHHIRFFRPFYTLLPFLTRFTVPSKLTPHTSLPTHRHADIRAGWKTIFALLNTFHLFRSWRENSCFWITPEWRTKLLPLTECVRCLCLNWEDDFSTGREKQVFAVCFLFVFCFALRFFSFIIIFFFVGKKCFL